MTETQDIVYREAAGSSDVMVSAPDCPSGAQASEEILPDAVTLFRFSALTYNAHRIHYDRNYARDIECYPGLVVHGPFTAMRLALFASEAHGGAPLRAFTFRGTSPLFDGQAFKIHAKSEGNAATLWAERPAGGLAMQASATF